MPFQKLTFYGDSLMLPRPGAVTPEESYAWRFESWLRKKLPDHDWLVLLRAAGSHNISEIAAWVASDVCYYADVGGGIAVLQAGIVDGAPRPVNQRVRRLISSLPDSMRAHAIHFLHHNRARILGRGLGSVITPLAKFEKAVASILEQVCDAHDHVFALTICPTDARTEKHSPGLNQNIVAYNGVWRRAQQKHADKVCLIDAHAFISSQPDFHHWLLEDGHHITPAMHQWIATEIMRVLEQRWQRGGSPPQ